MSMAAELSAEDGGEFREVYCRRRGDVDSMEGRGSITSSQGLGEEKRIRRRRDSEGQRGHQARKGIVRVRMTGPLRR